MKKQYFIPLLLSLLLLIGTGFINKCDFQEIQDVADEFDVIIELEEIHTVVLVNLIDINTGTFLDESTTLTFKGDYAPAVVDIYSDPIASATVSHGSFSFGIDNLFAPTEDEPVEFRVIARSEGYDANSASVSIMREGTHPVNIFLTPKSQAAAGAVV